MEAAIVGGGRDHPVEAAIVGGGRDRPVEAGIVAHGGVPVAPVMSRLAAAVKGRFLRFRREIIVVAYAIRHRQTPLRLKLAGIALMLYLASPVDLVPLTVPVAGLLDDLILVPWGLGMVVGRLPAEARADAEASAGRFIDRYVKRPLVFLALLLLALALVWTGLLWLLWWLLFG